MTYDEFLDEADQLNSMASTVFGRRSRTARAFDDAYKVAVLEKQMFEEDVRPEDTDAGKTAPQNHA